MRFQNSTNGIIQWYFSMLFQDTLKIKFETYFRKELPFIEVFWQADAPQLFPT